LEAATQQQCEMLRWPERQLENVSSTFPDVVSDEQPYTKREWDSVFHGFSVLAESVSIHAGLAFDDQLPSNMPAGLMEEEPKPRPFYSKHHRPAVAADSNRHSRGLATRARLLPPTRPPTEPALRQTIPRQQKP
jgi:hypothetical protein